MWLDAKIAGRPAFFIAWGVVQAVAACKCRLAGIMRLRPQVAKKQGTQACRTTGLRESSWRPCIRSARLVACTCTHRALTAKRSGGEPHVCQLRVWFFLWDAGKKEHVNFYKTLRSHSCFCRLGIVRAGNEVYRFIWIHVSPEYRIAKRSERAICRKHVARR